MFSQLKIFVLLYDGSKASVYPQKGFQEILGDVNDIIQLIPVQVILGNLIHQWFAIFLSSILVISLVLIERWLTKTQKVRTNMIQWK